MSNKLLPYHTIPYHISVIKIVKNFGIVGGGHWGALKSYKMIMAPNLSVNKIVKYCGKNIMLINNITEYCLSPTDA